MQRHSRILCGMVVAAFMVAGAAWAGAERLELAPPADDPLHPDATGHVVVHYVQAEDQDQGKDVTKFQVNVRGLDGDTEYSVWMLTPVPHGDDRFTTRRNGSGNIHIEHDGDHSWHLPVIVVDVALLPEDPDDLEQALEEATVLTTEP